MKKKIGLISIAIIFAIGIGFYVYNVLSDETSAEIPSASSFAPTFKDWTVHFSEEMNPETFTTSTVTVTNEDGKQVPVSFEWNDDFTVLTLEAPTEGYTVHKNYTIHISNSVETADGNNLTKSFTHNFEAVEELPKIKDNQQLLTLLKERMQQPEQENKLFSFGNEDSADDSAEMESATVNDSDSGASVSETNVQVSGIDEGDTVKTDGAYIYFARDSDLVIASAAEKDSKVMSTIEEERFTPREIYVQDDMLISIGHTHEPIRETKEPGGETINEDIAIFPVYSSQTTVFIYDITDRNNPDQIREVTFEGSYNASRLMDDHLYLVANERPPFHILEEEENMEIRPFVKDTAISDEGQPVDFDDMYFFPESDDETYLLLSSIDLTDMEKEVHVETYLGASNEMYMSENHLYIAVNKYDDSEEKTSSSGPEIAIARPAHDTEINQFKIDNGSISYNASTVVNGTLINQFAMDERNETFRVATTKGNTWNNEEESTNNLYTFDIDLNPLGSVEGLAKGERIYSVRFMEDIAYMVTFKEVDPLFVIDLQDATNPTVLGELKIPGFSNYLHPLDDNHVIGFGQNTKLEENEHSSEPIVRTDGIKISVFDVSDLTNPVEKYSEVIGQGGSHTELNHNHKALFSHPSRNLYGLPAMLFETKTVQKDDMTYEEQDFLFQGALLYHITAEDGIQLKDTITHQDENRQNHPNWEGEIKRIVSVNDTIYTLSFDQMSAYDIDSEAILQTIEFPKMKHMY
ncbi:Secreted protein containing C-terminal beta-propeller domain [Oceanobacillus limi]|uniref:Secreted protein containing C-terminal beta-propeller domain n=1 Tax=Oceanobacillus limi TaxID=930131 RepID=A0A1I0C4Z3_9BACI|nr:beta-propeller domain-containing protein [Oceanobacillus limi]SET14528.1 Secreted protein containing C-terminal beta-propeller domain [Oceanobacillus limi]